MEAPCRDLARGTRTGTGGSIAGARSPFEGTGSPDRTTGAASREAGGLPAGNERSREADIAGTPDAFREAVAAAGPALSTARLIPVPVSGFTFLRTDFGSAALSSNPEAQTLKTEKLKASRRCMETGS